MERKRIREVTLAFGQDLADGIKSAMDVDITVQFHEPTKVADVAGAPLVKGSENPVTEESSTLSACVRGGTTWFGLFRLEMNPATGYPCSMAYDEVRHRCASESELRVQLERLMQERGTYIVENINKHAKKAKWQRLEL